MSLREHVKLYTLLSFPVVVTKRAGVPATYYVDATGGDDDNSGLTAGRAWQTISKVNSSSFEPGDTIKFKRGEIWAEMLAPPSSGEDDNHIVFDAYGEEGDLPEIDGSALDHAMVFDDTVHHLTFKNIWFYGASGANNETVQAFSHDLLFDGCEFSHSALYEGLGVWSETGAEIYNVTVQNCQIHDNHRSGLFLTT